MRECLIMSTHTKYEWINYADVSEISIDWIKKHIGSKLEETDDYPISSFDEIDLKGYTYYKVYKCSKGILQYFNNEIGFRYKTGSYMYIRFYYHNDCKAYMERLLKDYNMSFQENTIQNKYEFNIGDVITFNQNTPLCIDDEYYKKMFNAPNAYLDHFDSKITDDTPLRDVAYTIATVFEDEDELYIIPAAIPDVTQYRLKNVPGLPYCAVGPIDYLFKPEEITVYKKFDDEIKEI